jgi:tripartite-type tricarboxylate transporter receptor subunit TctC
MLCIAHLTRFALAGAMTLMAAQALAQEPFPVRSVRIIVALPPGGGTDIAKAIQHKDVGEKLAEMGADPVGSTPREFGAFMQAESTKWARVIKEANIRPN